MNRRSLSVITVVVLFTVIVLAVLGGTAQARGLDQPQAPTDCSPSITVTNANNLGAGSLRQAITDVCADGTITFNGDYTITLSSELAINKSLTIDGQSNHVTVSGNHAVRVFNVTGGNVTFSHLTIANGNFPSGNAGGIYLQNSGVVVTITHSTLSGNSAGVGGGTSNNHGRLTVQNSTLSGNSTSSRGGAIDNWDGTVTVQNSTLSGNSATDYGAGILSYGGTVTVQNSTLSGNSAGSGDGIYSSGGTLALTQTIIANSASGSDCFGSVALNDHNLIEATGSNACGLTNGAGGSLIGVDPLLSLSGNYGGSTATFALLPGSPAINAGGVPCPATDQRGQGRVGVCDIGAYESQGFTLTKTGGNNQATLVNTEFPTPLQLNVSSSGSEPVNGGVVTFDGPSSGASITPSLNLTATIGGGQVARNVSANGLVGSYLIRASTTSASSAYFSVANIAASASTTTSLTSAPNPSNPGANVTFTATVTSAVGIPIGTVQFYVAGAPLGAPLTLTGGQAAVTTSTLSVGPHPITATYSGSANYTASTAAVLTQTVTCFSARKVSTTADTGPYSLRLAIATVCPGGNITFDGNYTIMLASELSIDKSLTIEGGSYQVTVNGNHATRVFNVSAGQVTFSHLHIADGNDQTTNCGTLGAYRCGGGIFVQNNTVAVTVTNSLLSGNSAAYGGGILNLGTVNVWNSTFLSNTAQASGGGLFGTQITTLTVQNSTFSGNAAVAYDGGGLVTQGTAIIQNSTFASNTAQSGGGLFNVGGGTLTLQNSTVSGNAGGGVGNYAKLHLSQSIIANSTSGGDCVKGTYGSILTNDHNLIESTGADACGLSNGVGGSLIGVDPVLSPLGNYGGSAQTFALLPGSPALNAGGATTCPATDQRGKNRVGACDIGAVESQGFSLVKTGGDNQTALINTAFTLPLSVTLNEVGGSGLPGAIITFTAPASGASLISPTLVTTVTNASGIAAIPVQANGAPGAYTVTAESNDLTSVLFALRNLTQVFLPLILK